MKKYCVVFFIRIGDAEYLIRLIIQAKGIYDVYDKIKEAINSKHLIRISEPFEV